MIQDYNKSLPKKKQN